MEQEDDLPTDDSMAGQAEQGYDDEDNALEQHDNGDQLGTAQGKRC